MAIANNQELAVAVSQAGDLLQSIQDYCQRTNRADSKVRFPRGLIGTADSYRELLPAYLDRDKMSNLAYAFMFLDVLWWLSSRTDIASVAKQMTIKSAIITLGTILEAPLYVPKLPKTKCLSSENAAGVKLRVENARVRGWLSDAERDALKQLWDQRTNVHQKKPETDSELDL